MKWRLSVGEILKALGNPEVRGTYDGEITGVADLRSASNGEIAFLSSGKYARFLAGSKAAVVIIPQNHEGQPPAGSMWIPAPDPSLALGKVCQLIKLRIQPPPPPGIHETATIDETARIDPSASIGPYCLVGPRAVIGPRVVLESHVRIEQEAEIGEDSLLQHGAVVGWSCRIGKRCRLFSSAVIGSDGFGYHSDQQGHQHLPQIGIVVVEDDVDIGSNSSLDRARFSETRIGQGTKIDNQVQIGHNVILGKHCIICAGVGISGSTEVGNFVIMAGQVGVAGHIKVGDGVIATGQTGITKDTPAGTVLMGTPGRPRSEELRRLAQLGQLPDIVARLKRLEENLSGD